MNRGLAAILAVLLLAGCREVRVKTYAQGTSEAPGGNAVIVVRDRAGLEALGIKAPVRFNHEFGVALLLGPHREVGWRQVIESIRANTGRVRIVAFEVAPATGADPAPAYRTFTLWIVPISVYHRGSRIDVVTPSDEPLASTVLR
ncbi:MAG: hypothetical protein JO177_04735 [Candidatus Eremiobacteraeota bacterium]|nr:hypothetical protein [Candidatus Eremiobacteraeota bacterium]